jgi:hypothetical protein
MPIGIVHHELLLCQPRRVGADEIHRHVLPSGPLEKENVRRPPPGNTLCLLLYRNAIPDAHLVEGVPEGVVALRAAVLLAAHKVVAEWVDRPAAQRAPR